MKETNAINILRRIIVILSVICLSLPICGMAAAEDVWDGTVASEFSDKTGDGTSAKPFLIKNGKELALFAAIVNGKDGINLSDYTSVSNITAQSICGKLDADIVLNAGNDKTQWKQWTPIGNIGTVPNRRFYQGLFYGDGKTVSGLYIDDANVAHGGLFGYTNAGSINELTVNGYVNCKMAGGIAGWSQSYITDCVNNATVIGSGFAGGVAGYSTNAQISNCVNNASVTSTGSGAGGICGSISDVTIEDCVNYESISGLGSAGGICGSQQSNSKIVRCVNNGAVSGANTAANIGGITGILDNSGGLTYILDCLNTGNVNGGGGIVDRYSTNSNGFIANCLNASASGMIVKTASASSFFYNCYYLENADDLAKAKSAWDLNNIAGIANTLVKGCYPDGTANTEKWAKGNSHPVLAKGGVKPAYKAHIDYTDAARTDIDLYSGPDGTIDLPAGDDYYKDTNGTLEFLSTDALTGDVTLYVLSTRLPAPAAPVWDAGDYMRASWSAVTNAESYSVQFYKDGSTQDDKAGDPITVSGNTNCKCHAGQTVLENGGGTYYFKVQALPAASSIDFSPSEPSAASGPSEFCVVKFIYNDGTGHIGNSIVINGDTVSPHPLTRAGYELDGWYTDSACTAKYNFDARVTADILLYAKWINALQKLIDDDTDGSITLDKGYTFDDDVEYDKPGVATTINFAGNTVAFDGAHGLKVKGGTLIIESVVGGTANNTADSITGEHGTDTAIPVVDVIGGNLTLNSGVITTPSGNRTVVSCAAGSEVDVDGGMIKAATSGYLIKNHGTVTVDGGTAQNSFSAIDNIGSGAIIINSGSVLSNGVAINAADGTVSVSGGAIQGVDNAIVSVSTAAQAVKIGGSPAITGAVDAHAAILNDGYEGANRIKVCYRESTNLDTAIVNDCVLEDADKWYIEDERYKLALSGSDLVYRQKAPFYLETQDVASNGSYDTLAEAVQYINEHQSGVVYYDIFVSAESGPITISDPVTITSARTVLLKKAETAVPTLALGAGASINVQVGELGLNSVAITYAGTDSAVTVSGTGKIDVNGASITSQTGWAIEDTRSDVSVYSVRIANDSLITGKTGLGDIKTSNTVSALDYANGQVIRILRADEIESGDTIVEGPGLDRGKWSLLNEGFVLSLESSSGALNARPKYTGYPVAVTIDAPLEGAAPAGSASVSDADISVDEIEWQPLNTTQFTAGTDYKVRMEIYFNQASAAFGSDLSATVNGKAATVITNRGISAIIEYDFGVLKDLQGLIDGTAPGGKLALTKGYTLDKDVTVDENIILDLNGFTIDCGADYGIKTAGCALTVTDAAGDGRITGSGNGATITLTQGASLAVTGGTVENSGSAAAVLNESGAAVTVGTAASAKSGWASEYNGVVVANNGYAIHSKGSSSVKVETNGRVFSQARHAIFSESSGAVTVGSAAAKAAAAKEAQEKVNVESKSASAIYNTGTGNVVINAGLVRALANMAIQNTSSGVVVVNGGAVEGGVNGAISSMSESGAVEIYAGRVACGQSDITISDGSFNRFNSRFVLAGEPEIVGRVSVWGAVDGSRYTGSDTITLLCGHLPEPAEAVDEIVVKGSSDKDLWAIGDENYRLVPNSGNLVVRFSKPFFVKSSNPNISACFADTLKGAVDFINAHPGNCFTVHVCPLDDISETVAESVTLEGAGSDVTLKSAVKSSSKIYTLEIGENSITVASGVKWFFLASININSESATRNTPLINGGFMPSSDGTLSFKVRYDPGSKGSGTAQADKMIYPKDDQTFRQALFTRTGYAQSGWAMTDGGDKEYELGESYTIYLPMTLYPTWVLDGAGTLPGDANADGKIDNFDAVTLLRYLDDLLVLSKEQVLNCDVNLDGEINTADAQKLVEMIAGK